MPEDSLNKLDLGKGESAYKEEGTVPKKRNPEMVVAMSSSLSSYLYSVDK